MFIILSMMGRKGLPRFEVALRDLQHFQKQIIIAVFTSRFK